jgi:hypothetical protein
MVNTLWDSNVDSVTVSYLALKSTAQPKTLLSELYWRNSAGNAYADIDEHKANCTTRNINGDIIS